MSDSHSNQTDENGPTGNEHAISDALATAEPHPGRQRGRTLPWVVTAVGVLAAVVFALLWNSKSADAERITKERDQQDAQVAAAQRDLDDLTAELESTRTELNTANTGLHRTATQNSDLTQKVEGLQAQIDDLSRQLKNGRKTGDGAAVYAPKASLEFGKAIGDEASPALTDAEARCLGGGAIDLLGLDVIFELGFSETPTGEQLIQILTATLRAVDQCGLTLERLGI